MSGILVIGDSHCAAEHPSWVTSSFAEQLGAINLGKSGAMTGTVLVDWEHRIRPYLTRNQRIVVLLGTNDSLFAWNPVRFEQNLLAIASRCLGAQRRVWLCAPWHAGPEYSNARVNEITQIVSELWGAPGIEPTGYLGVFDPPDLADGVHPSQAGHDHIAAKLGAFL